jgi:hypothetical protein
VKPTIPADLSIPAFLVREDTPELRAARDYEMQRGRRPVGKYRPAISAGTSEINSEETKMAKIGKKEQALKDVRAGKSDVPILSKLFPFGGKAKTTKTPTKVSETTDIPNSEIFGEKFDKAVKVEVDAANERIAKTAKKVAEKKPAPALAKPAGKPAAKGKGDTPAAKAKPAGKAPKAAAKGSDAPWRPTAGTKQAVMLDMVLRKEGATHDALCKKLVWKSCRVTLGRVCDRAGAKLEHRKVGDVTTYFAKL